MLTPIFTRLTAVLMIVMSVNCQQCRYVTVPVCDEQSTSSSGGNVAVKGERGDRGFSGKLRRKGKWEGKGKSVKKEAKEMQLMWKNCSNISRIASMVGWIVGLC